MIKNKSYMLYHAYEISLYNRSDAKLVLDVVKRHKSIHLSYKRVDLKHEEDILIDRRIPVVVLVPAKDKRLEEVRELLYRECVDSDCYEVEKPDKYDEMLKLYIGKLLHISDLLEDMQKHLS